MKVLETKRMLFIVYHPQIDEQTESINQEVGTFLWHYVNYEQDDWMEWLVAVEFQYNNKKHTVIRRTPFELNFGRHLWKGILTVKMELPKFEEFLEGLRGSWSQAKILQKKPWRNSSTRREEILKDWKLEIMYGWKPKTSIWSNSQRSWSRKDMDLLKSQRTLDMEHFDCNFQKNEWYNVFNKDLLTWCRKPQFIG